MATSDVALAHYRERQSLVAGAQRKGQKLWGEVDPSSLRSWSEPAGEMLTVLSGAQLAAARHADDYADQVLGGGDPAGRVAPDAFSGVASDGRPLAGLLWSPVVATKTAIARGMSTRSAMATGRATLDMIVRTQVADAGRTADGVAIAARPGTGYVRMLVGKSCSRCVILAGKFYRYNAGFQRHPGCDCIHVPSKGEQGALDEGLVSDPKEHFESLSESEQDRVFTQSGARAIRDGADMNQVVNARRGMSKAGPRAQRESVFGRDVFTTTEGTTTRGLAGQRLGARQTGRKRRGDRFRRAQTPRLMPESIYEIADSRDDAIRLLRRFGYIV